MIRIHETDHHAVLFCVVSFVLSAQQNTSITLTSSPNPANPSDISTSPLTVTPLVRRVA